MKKYNINLQQKNKILCQYEYICPYCELINKFSNIYSHNKNKICIILKNEYLKSHNLTFVMLKDRKIIKYRNIISNNINLDIEKIDKLIIEQIKEDENNEININNK
jgi:uncharacterized membrane protein